MINLLIVDDHEIVRHGLSRLLADVPGIKVIGVAASGEEGVKMAKEKRPDVVLMDVKMPGTDGLDATRKILRNNRDIKVLALTMCTDELFPTKLLQAGALGYITKDTGLQEMVDAIRSVYAGKRYLGPQIAQQLALKSLNRENEQSILDILSDRELQVFRMLTHGKKVKEISNKLFLSPKTVITYRHRLYEKLSVSTDVELTHLAIKHGLIETENN